MDSSSTDALVVVSGPMAGQTLPLERRELVLGRDSSNDVPLTAYSQLSRRHAKLVPTTGGWSIEDLNSTNGVLLNGTRLSQSPLKHGDRLKLGDFEALVRVYNPAPVPTSAPSAPSSQEKGLGADVSKRSPLRWVWPSLGIGIVLVVGALLLSGRGSSSGSSSQRGNTDADVQAKARRAIEPGSPPTLSPDNGPNSDAGPTVSPGDSNPVQAGSLAPPVNGRIAPQTVALAKNATVMIVHPEGGGYSFGSGFVSGNGHQIITNRHVVAEGDQAQDCTLIFGAGTSGERKVGVSASNIELATGNDNFAADLAVLTIPADVSVPSALPLGQSEAMSETDPTWVFGFPLGVETLTLDQELPSVSVKDANIERIQRGLVDGREEAKVIQLGSTVTHGNSGGPVLNAKGEVVGVISRGAEGTGISYAIPTVWIKRLLQ